MTFIFLLHPKIIEEKQVSKSEMEDKFEKDLNSLLIESINFKRILEKY